MLWCSQRPVAEWADVMEESMAPAASSPLPDGSALPGPGGASHIRRHPSATEGPEGLFSLGRGNPKENGS